MSLHITAKPSVHFENRPDSCVIDTIVIHSMHNPEGADPFTLPSCKECLDGVELSVHYLIGLDGEVWHLVSEDKKAWHAGSSQMPTDGRTGVNAFSIGIELIGSEDSDFTEEQYKAIATLCGEISVRHPISAILGHKDVAPERKSDPWGFDWKQLQQRMNGNGSSIDRITFPTQQEIKR